MVAASHGTGSASLGAVLARSGYPCGHWNRPSARTWCGPPLTRAFRKLEERSRTELTWVLLAYDTSD